MGFVISVIAGLCATIMLFIDFGVYPGLIALFFLGAFIRQGDRY